MCLIHKVLLVVEPISQKEEDIVISLLKVKEQAISYTVIMYIKWIINSNQVLKLMLVINIHHKYKWDMKIIQVVKKQQSFLKAQCQIFNQELQNKIKQWKSQCRILVFKNHHLRIGNVIKQHGPVTMAKCLMDLRVQS